MTFPTEEHVKAAQEAERTWLAKTGHRIWTSVSEGQVGLESAFYKAESGANNFGGIKANKAEIKAGKFKLCWTKERVNGVDVRVRAPFASYASLEEFYEAHARVLATYSGYKAGWHDTSPDAFLAHIAKPYATADKATYIAAVKGIMDHYGLRKFDLPSAPGVVKPPITQTNKGTAVVVGGTAVATASAHPLFGWLEGVPAGMLAGLLVVVAAGVAWWMLARRQAKAEILAAIAVKPMTPAELEEYIGAKLAGGGEASKEGDPHVVS